MNKTINDIPKTFRVCPPESAPPGFGGHVQFECQEHKLHRHITERLDKLSVWGGNTSNNSSKYSHWELTPYNFWEACRFLEDNGFTKV